MSVGFILTPIFFKFTSSVPLRAWYSGQISRKCATVSGALQTSRKPSWWSPSRKRWRCSFQAPFLPKQCGWMFLNKWRASLSYGYSLSATSYAEKNGEARSSSSTTTGWAMMMMEWGKTIFEQRCKNILIEHPQSFFDLIAALLRLLLSYSLFLKFLHSPYLAAKCKPGSPSTSSIAAWCLWGERRFLNS